MKRINQNYTKLILADKAKTTDFAQLIDIYYHESVLVLTQISLCEIPKITRAVILTLELPHDADVWVQA